MMDDLTTIQSFKLKGRGYTLTVLHLFSNDLQLFTEQLAAAVQQAPRLFEQTPVVLDCSALVEMVVDLNLLCQTMRRFGLYPVGIQNSSPLIQTAAHNLGLPILNASSQQDKSLSERKAPSHAEVRQVMPEPTKTQLHSVPIRSGQQIVSHGDLTVTAAVSHGAELLAEGHIHVYGVLRGRALAGITGNKQARIFCLALDAELVAIAGIYCLSDALPNVQGPCQVFLQDDCIKIEPL